MRWPDPISWWLSWIDDRLCLGVFSSDLPTASQFAEIYFSYIRFSRAHPPGSLALSTGEIMLSKALSIRHASQLLWGETYVEIEVAEATMLTTSVWGRFELVSGYWEVFGFISTRLVMLRRSGHSSWSFENVWGAAVFQSGLRISCGSESSSSDFDFSDTATVSFVACWLLLRLVESVGINCQCLICFVVVVACVFQVLSRREVEFSWIVFLTYKFCDSLRNN